MFFALTSWSKIEYRQFRYTSIYDIYNFDIKNNDVDQFNNYFVYTFPNSKSSLNNHSYNLHKNNNYEKNNRYNFFVRTLNLSNDFNFFIMLKSDGNYPSGLGIKYDIIDNYNFYYTNQITKHGFIFKLDNTINIKDFIYVKSINLNQNLMGDEYHANLIIKF